MSGDRAPNCNINGAINFIKNPLSQNTHVVLYGTEKILKNNFVQKTTINRYITFIYNYKFYINDNSEKKTI